jgi:hypothetical protein
MYNLEQTS